MSEINRNLLFSCVEVKILDINKTSLYYKQLSEDDLCNCAYCKNYIQEVKRTYPMLSEYLLSLGVDVEKPFEVMSLEPDENGDIEYPIVQYLVCGNTDNFEDKVIEDITIDISKLHPSSTFAEEHFIIDVYPIKLRWKM